MSDATAMTVIPEPMAVRGVPQELYDKQQLFKADLEAAIPQLEAALPKGVRAQALASMALTMVLDNPKLLDCEPLSLTRSVYKVASLNLRIGETCDIVPTKKRGKDIAECWIRVRGVVELAIRARAIQWAKYILICDVDDWSFENDELLHKPRGTVKLDCSNVTHVSAMVILPSGIKVWEQPWPVERILAHRDKYAKNLGNPDSPWNRDPGPMWGKTVLKSLLRFAPMSPELRAAINEGDGEVRGSWEAVPMDDPTAALKAGAALLSMGDGDDEPAEITMTLADAEAMTLPGGDKAWGGKGGQMLGTLKDALLSSVVKWIDGDAERGSKFAALKVACEIILGARQDAAESAGFEDAA